MREGRDMGDRHDRSDGSSDRDFRRERDGERERGTQRSGVEERGVRNGDGQLSAFSRFNDQGLPIRDDNDTASRFQWTYLLRESGNLMGDSVEMGFRGSRDANYGRRCDGLVGNSMPGDSERIRSVLTYGYDTDCAEYRGCTRDGTGCSVEEPEYHGRSRNVVTGIPSEGTEYPGRIRNVTGHSVEDREYHGRIGNVVTDRSNEGAEYYGRSINLTGPRAENVDYNGHTRNMTGLRIEGSDYNGNSRNMLTGQRIEGSDYNGNSRNMSTGLPVEDAGYHRGVRTVMTSQPVEDGGRSLVRDYQRSKDREILMKTYEEENCPRFRNEVSSHSLTPHSQTSGRHTPLQGMPFSNLEGPRQGYFRHPADGPGNAENIPSSSCYSPRGIVYSKSGTNSRPMSSKDSTYQSAEHSSSMGRHVEYNHSESQRSGMVYRRASLEDAYENHDNVQDYSDHRYTYGITTLDPALSRYDCLGNPCNSALDKDGLRSSDLTLQEAQRQRLEYGTEACYEFTPHDEECPYEIDVHGISYEDQTQNYLILEEGTLFVDEDAQQIMRSGDIDLHDQPKRSFKRKRGLFGKMSWPKRKTSTFGGRGVLSYDTAEPENDLDHSNRSSSHHFHLKETAGKSKTESRLPFGGLSKELQSRLSKPFVSSRNDVKNRLKHSRYTPYLYGPQDSRHLRGNVHSCVKSSLNVNHIDSQPYGKVKRNSTKKRLKPAHFMDVCTSDLQVSHPGLDIESQQKLASKNSVSTKEGLLQEADLDHSILKVKPLEKDPAENSEELKRQVDYWFLKCMIYLNTNPGRQKKLKERGKNWTLKCVICSSSKEFIQTKDVATHAFTSPKVGFRAAHLGFHRALCILMGWDPAVASNVRWVCKSLPDVEALALKEDIIVWPPVVIIHNGSARDFYNNEQVKISIEQLENILRAMGLSEGTTTVCHGKPGNPNIMLVKFNGTLSGLQEAERLHSVFSEKKRGRAQLQEIDYGVGCNESVAMKSEDNLELRETDAEVECNEGVALKSEDKIEFQKIAIVGSNEGGSQKSEVKLELQAIDAGATCNEGVALKSEDKLELQKIDAGVGCNEGVALKSEDKIELQDTSTGVWCYEGGTQKSADKKDLQEIDARVGCNDGVAQKSEDQIEDALYGYLGIVEDFDKLNYEMRRHCVAKSKKEILACIDTTT